MVRSSMRKMADCSGRKQSLALITAIGGIFIIGIVSALASNVQPGTRVATEIRAVLSAQAEAWNRGDIDGFMNGYARSHATEFVSGDKLTRGWQTVRDRYKKKYSSREKMGRLTFSEVSVTPLSRDAAVVIGCWKLVRRNDTPHGRFTLIFRRMPDGWRIVHDHTS